MTKNEAIAELVTLYEPVLRLAATDALRRKLEERRLAMCLALGASEPEMVAALSIVE